MEARKENKVYKINDQQKNSYLKQGFDIYDEDGNVIEHTPLKKIKYSDHLKIVNELKEQAKIPENVFDLLKKYAENKNIDIGQATSATGALTKIMEAEKQTEVQ